MTEAQDADSDDAGADSSRVRVIERSLDILEALSAGPRTLSEICRDTKLSKGTAFRLLAGLSHRGVVVKDPSTNRYMLGPGLLRLVSGAVSGLAGVATLGRDVLAELATATGETVALHVQVGLERVCIHEIPSTQAIRYTSSVGSSAPLSVGSAGKVLLASMHVDERDRFLALLNDDAVDGDLRSTLDTVASNGWAVSTGERVTGASAISVPVRSDQLLFALSVLGPTARLSEERLLEFLPELTRSAALISGLMSTSQPD